jgi:hypothetical protein
MRSVKALKRCRPAAPRPRPWCRLSGLCRPPPGGRCACFHEKRSFREIAEELNVSVGYARAMVAKSLVRLEELQHG